MVKQTENIIERMCRAMCRDQYPGCDEDEWLVTAKCPRWGLFVSQAKAALEAMREPTEAMHDAGQAVNIGPYSITSIWEEMIDAALEEDPR